MRCELLRDFQPYCTKDGDAVGKRISWLVSSYDGASGDPQRFWTSLHAGDLPNVTIAGTVGAWGDRADTLESARTLAG